MSGNNILETPEVKLANNISSYLIRKGGVEHALTCNDDMAKLIIDSYAAAEIRRLETDNAKLIEGGSLKVYRSDASDGSKVTVYTQSLGLWNGSPVEVAVFDYVKVPHVYLLKGRLQKDIGEDDVESSDDRDSVIDNDYATEEDVSDEEEYEYEYEYEYEDNDEIVEEVDRESDEEVLDDE